MRILVALLAYLLLELGLAEEGLEEVPSDAIGEAADPEGQEVVSPFVIEGEEPVEISYEELEALLADLGYEVAEEDWNAAEDELVCNNLRLTATTEGIALNEVKLSGDYGAVRLADPDWRGSNYPWWMNSNTPCQLFPMTLDFAPYFKSSTADPVTTDTLLLGCNCNYDESCGMWPDQVVYYALELDEKAIPTGQVTWKEVTVENAELASTEIDSFILRVTDVGHDFTLECLEEAPFADVAEYVDPEMTAKLSGGPECGKIQFTAESDALSAMSGVYSRFSYPNPDIPAYYENDTCAVFLSRAKNFESPMPYDEQHAWAIYCRTDDIMTPGLDYYIHPTHYAVYSWGVALPNGLQTWTGYASTISTADTPDIMPTAGFTIECLETLEDLSALPEWGSEDVVELAEEVEEAEEAAEAAEEAGEAVPVVDTTGSPLCYGNLELSTTSDDEFIQMLAGTYTYNYNGFYSSDYLDYLHVSNGRCHIMKGSLQMELGDHVWYLLCHERLGKKIAGIDDYLLGTDEYDGILGTRTWTSVYQLTGPMPGKAAATEDFTITCTEPWSDLEIIMNALKRFPMTVQSPIWGDRCERIYSARYNNKSGMIKQECEGDTVNLIEFNMFENLETVPEGFITDLSRLTGLKRLEFSLNALNDLPANMAELSVLEVLDLTHNDFDTLPASVTEMTNLKVLWLISNDFKTFPANALAMTNLEALSLWGNDLTTVGIDLSPMVGLKTLYLSHNDLTSLAGIEGLTGLEDLRVEYNDLVTVPEVAALVGLKKLVLHHNPLESVPDLSALTQLESLDLTDLKLLPCVPNLAPGKFFTEHGSFTADSKAIICDNNKTNSNINPCFELGKKACKANKSKGCKSVKKVCTHTCHTGKPTKSKRHCEKNALCEWADDRCAITTGEVVVCNGMLKEECLEKGCKWKKNKWCRGTYVKKSD